MTASVLKQFSCCVLSWKIAFFWTFYVRKWACICCNVFLVCLVDDVDYCVCAESWALWISESHRTAECELVNSSRWQNVSWWIFPNRRVWIGESSQTAECELVSPPKLQSVNWWVPPNCRVWIGQSYKMADCLFTLTRGFPANAARKPRWRWRRQGALFVPLHWNCCVLSWATAFFFMTCLTSMEQMKEYINSHSLLWCNEHQTEHTRHVCYVNVAVSCLRMLKVSLQIVR